MNHNNVYGLFLAFFCSLSSSNFGSAAVNLVFHGTIVDLDEPDPDAYYGQCSK